MDHTYEIFQRFPKGPIWVEAVAGLKQTKQRLESLNEAHPGEYFAYDVREARIVAEVSFDPKSDLNAN